MNRSCSSPTRVSCPLLFCLLAACCLVPSAQARSPLESPLLPDGLGVNIHFTDPKPGEMEMLAAGGFRWVRMDLSWGRTERVKGEYDFSHYDNLMEALKPHGIRALLILDYSNKYYDQGLSPCSDEGRQAFARWAAAAAAHFRGRGVLWEMYNEPNIKFWKPAPKVDDYVKLALEVGHALRQAAPDELYIGPATSQIDLRFLEECFNAGLLEHWSAVSVHPYRFTGPETAAAEYAALRRLIQQYAPQGKRVPILSGEWGYSSVRKGIDDTVQGRYLPRQWLTNVSNDVPLSIWYDWHDDGADPEEKEHHFGTVRYPYRAGQSPVYEPKPAYLAAQTLTRCLAGFRFSKRLHVGRADDYVLLFHNGANVRLAAWTTSAEPHEATIPASPGRFQVTSHLGEALPAATADGQGLRLTLNDGPQYLTPDRPNDLLSVAAAWDRAPLDVHRPGGPGTIALGLVNPLSRPIDIVTPGDRAVRLEPGARLELSQSLTLRRSPEPVSLDVALEVKGLPRLVQQVEATANDPLRLFLGLIQPKDVLLVLDNPSGVAFGGQLLLSDVQGLDLPSPQVPVTVAQGQTRALIQLARRSEQQQVQFAARLVDAGGAPQLALPTAKYRPVDDFSKYTAESLAKAYRVVADGDRKVGSEQSIGLADAPAHAPVPVGQCLKLDFRMEPGWKFLRLAPVAPALKAIEGRPKALAVWVCLESERLSPRARLSDAGGQIFQPTGPTMKDRGWHRVVIDLQREPLLYWGGANDGKVHEPLRWDTLLLLDKLGRDTVYQGTLYVAAPVLVY